MEILTSAYTCWKKEGGKGVRRSCLKITSASCITSERKASNTEMVAGVMDNRWRISAMSGAEMYF